MFFSYHPRRTWIITPEFDQRRYLRRFLHVTPARIPAPRQPCARARGPRLSRWGDPEAGRTLSGTPPPKSFSASTFAYGFHPGTRLGLPPRPIPMGTHEFSSELTKANPMRHRLGRRPGAKRSEFPARRPDRLRMGCPITAAKSHSGKRLFQFSFRSVKRRNGCEEAEVDGRACR